MSECALETDIEKLTAVFRGMEPNKIDHGVVEAKKRAEAERLKSIKEGLQMRFAMCMEELKARYSGPAIEIIIEGFRKKWEKVMPVVADNMDTPIGHYSFLPVIRREFLGIYGLTSMVQYKGTPGYTQLDSRKITDVVNLPNDPCYFAIDVEPGKETQGKSPLDAERIIKGKNRSCLTNDETLSLCVFTNVLSDHYVYATGSRFPSRFYSGRVSVVRLDNGCPKLDWNLLNADFGHYGSPSARMRI